MKTNKIRRRLNMLIGVSLSSKALGSHPSHDATKPDTSQFKVAHYGILAGSQHGGRILSHGHSTLNAMILQTETLPSVSFKHSGLLAVNGSRVPAQGTHPRRAPTRGAPTTETPRACGGRRTPRMAPRVTSGGVPGDPYRPEQTLECSCFRRERSRGMGDRTPFVAQR